eukprot:gene19858-23794_t
MPTPAPTTHTHSPTKPTPTASLTSPTPSTTCGWSLNNIGSVAYAGSTTNLCSPISSCHLTNLHQWLAKAGVMFRESLAPGSIYVYLFVSPEHGINLQCRSSTNGKAFQQAQFFTLGFAPRHLRITRSGNTFTGQTSITGLIWVNHGSCIVPMSKDATAGLAITSHDNTKISSATFDSISISH